MGTSSLHSVRTHLHILRAGPGAIFPLLCPTREYDWIPGWSCELVHSISGFAEQDCLFITAFPGHGREVWLQTRHEPCRAVEFVRAGDARAMRYTLELLPAQEATALRITQRATYLGQEAANRHRLQDDAVFAQQMPELMRLLERHLARNTATVRNTD